MDAAVKAVPVWSAVAGGNAALHVVPSYLPATRYGGPIQSVHGLCKTLVARNCAVEVATTDADGPGRLDFAVRELDGVHVTYAPVRFPRRLYYAPQLAETVRNALGRVAVVHLHSVFLWPTLAAARLASAYGVPYVLSPRGMLVRDLFAHRSRLAKSAWVALFERRTIEGAAAIHVTSQIEADELARFGFRLPRVEVIPNGVDAPDTRAKPASNDISRAIADGTYILAFGRINWKKNLGAAIEAVATSPELRLVIAGPADPAELRKLQSTASSSGAASRVLFIARDIQGADKDALISSCAALVMPSLSENFGNVALEAMAAGRPVIVSRGSGIAELVRVSGGGMVTETDARSIATALAGLASDPTGAAMMGQRGARMAREALAWPLVADRMIALYEQVAGQRQGGPR